MSGPNVRIARQLTLWGTRNGCRKAFINNFSIAGQNTALLVEEAPEVVMVDGTDPRDTHTVTISDKSAGSLKRNFQSLITFLASDSSTQVD